MVLMLSAIVAGCGSSPQPKQQTNPMSDDIEEPPTHRNPLFTLFDSDGQGAYQLYRNGDRITSFTLDGGRRPVDICSSNDDCYILISETPKGDTTDTVWHNAEIFKNGRRAMELDEKFQALNMEMEDGHFFVLGKYDDREYVVYRDGLRILKFPAQQDCRPAGMHVFGQTVYLAMQRGKTTDIYKDKNKLFSIDGVCKGIKASSRGVYSLMTDTMYMDRNALFKHEYFRYADKEMYASPTSLATSNKDILVGTRASFDDRHTYAGIFLNQQTYTTVKPDDKHIGDSDLSTVCCGVAVSGETYYYVTTTLAADMTMMKPVTYYLYADHSELSVLSFDNENARLLMMTSN